MLVHIYGGGCVNCSYSFGDGSNDDYVLPLLGRTILLSAYLIQYYNF
jgi:hypothetical protein